MPLTDSRTLIERSARARRQVAVWLVLANTAIAVLLISMVWQMLSASRRSYEGQARDVATGLAAVAKLDVESEINRIDAVVQATAAEIERLLASGGASDALLNDVLLSRYRLLADIEYFRLTDERGEVRWGTALPAGAPAQVADRDYFEQARAARVSRTLVAGPLRSRVSGNWVIAFVRPLQRGGHFAGVLYVSVSTDHFRRLFSRYRLEALDSISLRRDDMQLVARVSPGSAAQGEVGDTVVSAGLLSNVKANPREGSLSTRVAIDGEVRTTTYLALDTWPFIVYAGVSDRRFMQPWRAQVWMVVSLATLVWLLGAIATWSVYRADKRRHRAMRALAEQSERVRALLRIAADGIHIVDRGGRLVEMSDSFAEMLKSTREKLLRRQVSDWDANQDDAAIMAWLDKVKDGDRQRVDVQHRRDDGQVIDVDLHMSVADIGGELLVFATGRDVTQERRRLKEQSAMLESDLIGIARLSNRVITWHNRAVARIFDYGPGELDGQPVRLLYCDDESYQAMGRDGYAALEAQSQYRTQLRMRRRNGDVVWVDFGAASLSETEIFVMLVDITAMKTAHEELAHAAFHDALTQLPNRTLLYDRIEQALAVAAREQRQVALGYLDLDGFKAVNDTYGHDAGDQLLAEVARRLLAGVRPADTVARIGGDEFVVLLTALEPGGWDAIFQRLCAAIEQPIRLASGTVVSVGATLGVAVSRAGEPVTADELVERADHAMLRGKRGVRSR
ncbi:diguanylate cyclase domain-containing protein [Roseateles sp. BYS78W]|uniref:Diguanylate cyclase domain-containing protein n=1 Tax=Pelomonas candidula TaxID=3299025 RepID=A0ABW7HDN8_9BURK